jgi:hypothetical protein
MNSTNETDSTRLIVRETAVQMRQYRDRAVFCIDQLDEAHIWYRPNPVSNSIENLILHMTGSLREWSLGGIGNLPLSRDRPAEFSATSGQTKSELVGLLQDMVNKCSEIIDSIPAERISEKKLIQGEEVTIARALVGAVSHFGFHVGQMHYIAKMLLSHAYLDSWKPQGGTSH